MFEVTMMSTHVWNYIRTWFRLQVLLR